MIGWMQNGDTVGTRDIREPWFSRMSLPGELEIREGKLWQYPLRELELYRKNKVEYQCLRLKENGIITSAYSEPKDVTDGLQLPGISGRCLDWGQG